MDKVLENKLNQLKLAGIDVKNSENGFEIIEVKNKNIKKIVIPEGVTRILGFGFMNQEFVEIRLPSTLEGIGCNAFDNCLKLERIEIPNNVKYIEEGAFNRCIKLKAVKFPEHVTEIGKWACAECWELAKVEVLGKIIFIGDYAFKGCKRLEAIKLTDSVKGIGEYAFSDCGIKEFICPDSLEDVEIYAFSGCDKLEKVEFNDRLRYLKRGAFMDCLKLKDVMIPCDAKLDTYVFERAVNVVRVRGL